MDKRTLELAARAAGRTLEWSVGGKICRLDKELTGSANNDYPWCPDSDYGDFARLAEAIGATIDFKSGAIEADDKKGGGWVTFACNHDNDIKKALVALAARIGESMQ